MLRSLLATFQWREQNLKFPLFPASNTLEDSPTSTLRNFPTKWRGGASQVPKIHFRQVSGNGNGGGSGI